MKITAKTSLMGFLVALSAISASTPTIAATDTAPQTVEGRLSRLTTLVRERANQLPVSEQLSSEQLVAIAWGNGGGGAWRNGGGGGGAWGNGGGGGAWRNGWGDGGGYWRNY
ncbi:MAG TPA: GrrA/OscA1 family cyclophane-containing rSAM-modified RiPP [Coleofasciculaceae cyanobacterium]